MYGFRVKIVCLDEIFDSVIIDSKHSFANNQKEASFIKSDAEAHVATSLLDGKWQKARLTAFINATEAIKVSPTLVIIDDTNEYRSMRKPYFRLA